MERRSLPVLLGLAAVLVTSACSTAPPKVVTPDDVPSTSASPKSGGKDKGAKDAPQVLADGPFQVGPLYPVGPGLDGKTGKKKGGGSTPAPGTTTPPPPNDTPAPGAVINDTFDGPDRLVTNAWAKWNRAGATSPIWEVTSGSLFRRNGVGYSGYPDSAEPNAESSNGTGSNIFRADTKRRDMKDVRVDLKIRNLGLRSGGPDTDGIHVWLRYQTQFELYVVSLNRRDNSIVIKKKLAGGTENGGTYHELGQTGYTVPYGKWQSFSLSIRSAGDAAVITVKQGGRQLLSVTDRGTGGHVITNQGAVGVRADRCEFEFTDFRVYNL
ncbi:hypothetical protein [Actinocorallia longicatena]